MRRMAMIGVELESSGCGVPDPFRGQKTDQQRAVHGVTLSHQGRLTFTSVPRVIIRTWQGFAATLRWLFWCPIRKAQETSEGRSARYPLTGDRIRKGRVCGPALRRYSMDADLLLETAPAVNTQSHQSTPQQ